MRINANYVLSSNPDDSITTNLFGTTEVLHRSSDNERWVLCKRIKRAMEVKGASTEDKAKAISEILSDWTKVNCHIFNFTDDAIEERLPTATSRKSRNTKTNQPDREFVRNAVTELLSYMSEFSFSPGFRFVNTLCIVDNPKTYIKNYFEVQDHPDYNAIVNKIEAAEFNTILANLRKITPAKKINTRITIYYGDAGAGKTDRANKEAKYVIPCHNELLPDKLMQNFAFDDDGKAMFEKSDVWRAMENGEVVLLDEINLLPYDTLRFLQGLTDDKDVINHNGYVIKIHPNFRIIGTMNLEVNGIIQALPNPIVDRAENIIKFVVTADALTDMLIGDDTQAS